VVVELAPAGADSSRSPSPGEGEGGVPPTASTPQHVWSGVSQVWVTKLLARPQPWRRKLVNINLHIQALARILVVAQHITITHHVHIITHGTKRVRNYK